MIPSPIPIHFTGRPSSSRIATTTPPFAVPSSLVSTTPVILVVSVNTLAWVIAFCPVVASSTRNTSWGASGISRLMIRSILPSSFIRLTLLCRRPAVSINSTSVPRALAAFSASNTTAAGSAPSSWAITSHWARSPQIFSWAEAAARKVSPAAIITL